MASPPRVAYVVSHTHWDREWYLTFHEFRVKLTDIVRRVLDTLESDGVFRHFLLDGQAIVVEDHLTVHPEDEPRIRKLVEAGALSLGPWYVLPDEFLVSAESTVRNLIIGHRIAGGLGRPQRVGYMPDSFGHLAQLPQILCRAGLDSLVYTRGDGDEIEHRGHEFAWRAPDGSEVLAVNQCQGYCNAGGLGHEEIWHAHTRREVQLPRAVQQVRELFDKMAQGSRTDIRLLNNGGDHFPPQRDLDLVLDALREAFPATEFKHASLGEYVGEVRASGVELETFEGELLGGRRELILSGVWSARMPLKQQNDHCQTLLADVLEPLCAYTHFLHGRAYPSGAIDRNWKLLMHNHPHDSICGCSIDAVHREMGPRFEGVARGAEQLVRQELEQLSPTFARRAEDDGETVICVANPLPEARRAVVERMVVLQPPAPRAEGLRLFDERDEPVAFEVLDRHFVERFWGVDYRLELDAERQREKFGVYADRFGRRILRTTDESDTSDCYLTLRFVADLPGMGHARFRLREDPDAPASSPEASVVVSDDQIENATCRVRLHTDGTFDVEDKATGECYPGLNCLEDTEDVGDEYDYSPAAESRTFTSKAAPGTIRTLEHGGLRGRLEVAFTLQLPAAIDDDRRRRSQRLVDCPVVVRIGLEHGSPLVDVELHFDNRARDHRLRVKFPAGLRTDTIVSDGHFMIHHRPVNRPTGDDWVQPAPPTWPQQDFSLLQDGRRGLALFNRGLPEIEATQETDDTTALALTLLRGVEWLSRDDFETRKRQNAGATLHTPEAQCLGPHRYRYAVLPFAGDYLRANVKGIGRRWRTSTVAVQGVADQSVPGGCGLLVKLGTKTSISAIKKHESRDTLVVRLYNLTAESVDETLTFGADLQSAFKVNLLEEREDEIPSDGPRRLPLRLGPHEILSLEVELASTESRPGA